MLIGSPQPGVAFTIGYERAGLLDLIAALHDAGVKRVLDIRGLPLSRRAGFSKTPLSFALAGAGLGYLHLRSLGTPAALRYAHRAGMDRDEFRRACRELLGAEDAALQEAGALLAEQPGCLLCVEADADDCHRAVVAELLLERGLVSRVEHLRVPGLAAPRTRGPRMSK